MVDGADADAAAAAAAVTHMNAAEGSAAATPTVVHANPTVVHANAVEGSAAAAPAVAKLAASCFANTATKGVTDTHVDLNADNRASSMHQADPP